VTLIKYPPRPYAGHHIELRLLYDYADDTAAKQAVFFI
jgi:hypothetical protein